MGQLEEKKEMKDKLTPKNKKFVKTLAKTGEIGKSAVAAGYHHTYGSQLLQQPKICTALQTEMENQGLGDTKLIKKLKHGLSAYHAPSREGGKKYPDFFTRYKYLDMALKLTGGYAPEKFQVEERKIVLIVTPQLVDGLRDSKVITPEEADIIEAEIIEETSGAREESS